MELVKLPEPVPSVVLELAVVGGILLLTQHMPLVVIEDPPSLVILPPVIVDVDVIAETLDVVNVGKEAVVDVVTWFP